MHIRGIFVASMILALSGPMAGLAYADNDPSSAAVTPAAQDPAKEPKTFFPPSAATQGTAVVSPSLGRIPELDARACTAQSHCATPSPALDRVIVTPRQIDLSRLPARKHRG